MNSDPQLEQIRQQQMAKLAAQNGGQMPASADDQKKAEEQRQAQEEARQEALSRLMEPAARERLRRIALVKPEKAQGVENMLLQMSQRGQLSEVVSDKVLMGMLNQVNEKMGGGSGAAGPKIERNRRSIMDDDDW